MASCGFHWFQKLWSSQCDWVNFYVWCSFVFYTATSLFLHFPRLFFACRYNEAAKTRRSKWQRWVCCNWACLTCFQSSNESGKFLWEMQVSDGPTFVFIGCISVGRRREWSVMIYLKVYNLHNQNTFWFWPQWLWDCSDCHSAAQSVHWKEVERNGFDRTELWLN